MFPLIVGLSVFCLVSSQSVNSDRIVNGETASILNFPYQASLQIYNQHFCGASIISNQWACTAAHCKGNFTDSDLKDMSLRVGSSFWKSGGVTRLITDFVVHPEYNPPTEKNDVALLRMDKIVVYSSTVKPIKIVAAGKSCPKNTAVIASGWGRLSEGNKKAPDQLQSVSLTFLTKSECSSQQYGYGRAITDEMVCAVGPGKDACQGDSGGPLACDSDTIYLVGVVSWGVGCGRAGYPGVYTDLANPSIQSWMKKTTQDHTMFIN